MKLRASRLIFLLLAIVLSAALVAVIPGRQISPFSGTSGEHPSRELVFALREGESSLMEAAAREFCSRAEGFASGSLTFRIETFPDPEAALGEEGEGADLILLEGGSGYNAYLDLLSSPMLYRNHQHFTMTANSQTILRLLEEELRPQRSALPLGAFYGGSRQLLSTLPLEEILGPVQNDGIDPLALLLPYSQLTGPLRSAGIGVEINSDRGVRYQMTAEIPSLLTEFTTSEVYQANWSDSGLFYYHTMHNMNIRWLLISSDAYDALSPLQQAALAEASAYLYPAIDEQLLLRESMNRTRLREMGMVVGISPTALRSVVLRGLAKSAKGDPLAEHLLAWIEAAYPAV